MYEAVTNKFTRNLGLKKDLLATGDEDLIEGNKHNDTYWGVNAVSGYGQNKLGKILVRVREEIRAGE